MPATKTRMPSAQDIDIEADVEAAAILADVKAAGLDVGKLAETDPDKQGAFIDVTLYHAITGVPWTGPLYMTTGEGGANSLLKYRFNDRVALEAMKVNPADWLGKQVWRREPQASVFPEGSIRCRFSIHQDDETKANIKALGFYSFCSKDVLFQTESEENSHVVKRHPKFHSFEDTKRKALDAQEAKEASRAQTAALLAMAEKLTKGD